MTCESTYPMIDSKDLSIILRLRGNGARRRILYDQLLRLGICVSIQSSRRRVIATFVASQTWSVGQTETETIERVDI
jgi:hypothetical protein